MFSFRLEGTKKIKGTMENLLRCYGLNANETVIVDDNPVVLGHATKLGVNHYRLTPVASFRGM